MTVPEGLLPARVQMVFRARIVEEAEQGQVITNQATLADDDGATWRSDDPNLPGSPQPTVLQVGSAGAVAAQACPWPRFSAAMRRPGRLSCLARTNGTHCAPERRAPPRVGLCRQQRDPDGAPLSTPSMMTRSASPGAGRLEL